MISPQASIPRHWSSPSGERKDEDIERCPIILTSTITPDLLEMIEFLYLIVADICTIHKYLRGK